MKIIIGVKLAAHRSGVAAASKWRKRIEMKGASSAKAENIICKRRKKAKEESEERKKL
jgi:hypothetical protein